MANIELLLPAGNLEKLKFALLFGADACYIGAKKYSLRAQASNFTVEDLKEALSFAHSLNKKVYITVNVIPRENEIDGIKDYLKELESIEVDGIIVSSPVILYIAKTYTKLHVSISTQMSVVNSSSVNFFSEMGANRVVLGRELSIDEIRDIKNNTNTELEVFIHGGMCSGYSGRCTLSNYMSDRDANRGGCAHSCRWNYDLYLDNKKVNPEGTPFQISSKDLCAINYIKDLYDIGIESLKIEGRMKSVHYVATLAYTYRMLLDDIINNDLKDGNYYLKMLESSENRSSACGFFDSANDDSITLYSKTQLEANQSFLGAVLEYNKDTSRAIVEVRNHFTSGIYQVMSPSTPLYNVNVKNIYKEGEIVDAARHALEIVEIETDVVLKKNDIIRRVS